MEQETEDEDTDWRMPSFSPQPRTRHRRIHIEPSPPLSPEALIDLESVEKSVVEPGPNHDMDDKIILPTPPDPLEALINEEVNAWISAKASQVARADRLALEQQSQERSRIAADRDREHGRRRACVRARKVRAEQVVIASKDDRNRRDRDDCPPNHNDSQAGFEMQIDHEVDGQMFDAMTHGDGNGEEDGDEEMDEADPKDPLKICTPRPRRVKAPAFGHSRNSSADNRHGQLARQEDDPDDSDGRMQQDENRAPQRARMSPSDSSNDSSDQESKQKKRSKTRRLIPLNQTIPTFPTDNPKSNEEDDEYETSRTIEGQTPPTDDQTPTPGQSLSEAVQKMLLRTGRTRTGDFPISISNAAPNSGPSEMGSRTARSTGENLRMREGDVMGPPRIGYSFGFGKTGGKDGHDSPGSRCERGRDWSKRLDSKLFTPYMIERGGGRVGSSIRDGGTGQASSTGRTDKKQISRLGDLALAVDVSKLDLPSSSQRDLAERPSKKRRVDSARAEGEDGLRSSKRRRASEEENMAEGAAMGGVGGLMFALPLDVGTGQTRATKPLPKTPRTTTVPPSKKARRVLFAAGSTNKQPSSKTPSRRHQQAHKDFASCLATPTPAPKGKNRLRVRDVSKMAVATMTRIEPNSIADPAGGDEHSTKIKVFKRVKPRAITCDNRKKPQLLMRSESSLPEDARKSSRPSGRIPVTSKLEMGYLQTSSPIEEIEQKHDDYDVSIDEVETFEGRVEDIELPYLGQNQLARQAERCADDAMTSTKGKAKLQLVADVVESSIGQVDVVGLHRRSEPPSDGLAIAAKSDVHVRTDRRNRKEARAKRVAAKHNNGNVNNQPEVMIIVMAKPKPAPAVVQVAPPLKKPDFGDLDDPIQTAPTLQQPRVPRVLAAESSPNSPRPRAPPQLHSRYKDLVTSQVVPSRPSPLLFRTPAPKQPENVLTSTYRDQTSRRRNHNNPVLSAGCSSSGKPLKGLSQHAPHSLVETRSSPLKGASRKSTPVLSEAEQRQAQSSPVRLDTRSSPSMHGAQGPSASAAWQGTDLMQEILDRPGPSTLVRAQQPVPSRRVLLATSAPASSPTPAGRAMQNAPLGTLRKRTLGSRVMQAPSGVALSQPFKLSMPNAVAARG